VKLEVISPQREIAVYRIASDRFDLEELEKDPLAIAGSGPLPSAAARRGGQVQPGSAAAEAGFRDGDRVLAIDGKAIALWADLAAARGPRDRQLRFDDRAGRRPARTAGDPATCRRRAGKNWDDWA
jgi:hypothetical protein